MKALAFLHDMLLPISGVVDVDGVELGVRVKSVFVRENGATGEVGNEEVVQEALMWKVLRPLLVMHSRAIFLQCAPQWPLVSLVGVHDSSSEC